MTVSERIYKIMESKCMNQSAVARAAGFTPKAFNNMLRGRKTIKTEYLLSICDALSVTPNELFGLADDARAG